MRIIGTILFSIFIIFIFSCETVEHHHVPKTANEALRELMEGNQRYVNNVPMHHDFIDEAHYSEKDQHLRRSQRPDRPDFEQWPSSPPGSGVLSDRRDGRSDQSVSTADDGLCLLLSTKGR